MKDHNVCCVSVWNLGRPKSVAKSAAKSTESFTGPISVKKAKFQCLAGLARRGFRAKYNAAGTVVEQKLGTSIYSFGENCSLVCYWHSFSQSEHQFRDMGNIDEYNGLLLDELEDEGRALHGVVRNIMDEPIPEAVKARLLKPLPLRKYRSFPPSHKKKERKRKVLQEEFDPLTPNKVKTSQYQEETLGVFAKEEKADQPAFWQTPWVIGSFLRGWQKDVDESHPNSADSRVFLGGSRPQIRVKLEEELRALGGVKFQLTLKVQLRKVGLDGSEEYTDPVLRHKQEALHQAGEIKGALDESHILELLEKWTQWESGWVVDRVQTLWLNIARYQPKKADSTSHYQRRCKIRRRW